MIDSRMNLKIVRASAWYDLVVTSALMTPWTAAIVLSLLASLSAQLGLERGFAPLDAVPMMLANLLGSVVVVWSLWRVRHASQRVGHYDVIARVLFAVWQVYAVSQGASYLILVVTAMEIVFGIAQLLPVREAGDQPQGVA